MQTYGCEACSRYTPKLRQEWTDAYEEQNLRSVSLCETVLLILALAFSTRLDMIAIDLESLTCRVAVVVCDKRRIELY